MEEEVKITDAEWEVMKYIWKNQYCTMGEIRRYFEETTSWNASTIKTLVLRLLNKGVLKCEGGVRKKKYFTNYLESDCKRQETKNLLDKLFDGSVKMMVSNLVEESDLSKADIDELMSIIDKMEE